MGAIQHLNQNELKVRALPLDRLDVSPADGLNNQLREWNREHKPKIELMSNLVYSHQAAFLVD